jgi:predicted glycosyltransferase involved in capsule biosynthesis
MFVGRGHQFVLVNYDYELDKWIKEQTLRDLIYKKVEGEWNISKAKNISHNMGDGDILFCLDADTYIHEQAIDDLTRMFKRGYYFTHPYAKSTPLAIWKDDFIKVGGWDEKIKYRGEDIEMACRLEKMGIKPHTPFDSTRIITHINHEA